MTRRDRPPGPVELLEVRQVILAGGARDARAEEAPTVAPLTAVTPGAGRDARLECVVVSQCKSLNEVTIWESGWRGHLARDSSKGTEGGEVPLRISAHLSLIGEASQETLPLTPVQDLQLFIVDAVLLPYVLSRVQRRTLFVHAKLTTSSAAALLEKKMLYT